MQERVREWMQLVEEGPPRGLQIAIWAIATLGCLVAASIVMIQWAAWLFLTMQILTPWGMALGGVMVAVQILTIFGRSRAPKASCSIPR